MIRPLMQSLSDSVAYIITSAKNRPEAGMLGAAIGLIWGKAAPVLGAAFPIDPVAIVAIGGLLVVDFALGVQCAKAEGRPINSHTSRAMSKPKLIGYTTLYCIGALSVGASGGNNLVYLAILGYITGQETWSGWEKLHRMGFIQTPPDEVEWLRPFRAIFSKKSRKPEKPHIASEFTGKRDDPNG
ncbi:hypothetical protein D3C72_1145050 [compost metagenome]